MKRIIKSLVALSVTSALSLSVANAATYQVIDKGDVSSLKYTYAQQDNNLGETAISGASLYNFPVQFQYLDEDDFDAIVNLANRAHDSVHELENIEDEAALRDGNPTANDLAWAVRYLEGIGNSLSQKVGGVVAMLNVGNGTEEFVVFDQPFENTSTLTRSTVDYVNGISDSGWLYGNASSPYLPLDFVNSDDEELTFWVREFATRAYISTDQGQTVKPILAPVTDYYGGESAILDINGYTAVGYASTSLNENRVESIENEDGGCVDSEILEDVPYEACVQNLSNDLYFLSSYLWTLDENANVVDQKSLGQLVTPHEDDTRVYKSYAQAVNVNGVAVGFAHGWVDETETEPSKGESRSFYAVVYKDGEVISLTQDHGKYFDSRAYDISDSGIAVGHVNTYVNGNLRTKFYYVDTNAPASDMNMVFPDDFFEGSSSTARAINEVGFIVGEGEVETHNSTSKPRRTHGFLYDMNNESFTDLNDFLSCDSAYTIIEARDINNNNEISATAVVKVPRRDAKGELMVDEQGNQLTEDVIRAVTLTPIDGELEDCSEVEEKIKRKGAGFNFGLIALLALFGLRRTRKYSQ
ncbi:DUF3466 family protein [Colwellia sp. MEBiC06753]